MKTFFQRAEDAQIARKWRIIDATGIPVGRLATQIAVALRGKDKPVFTSHVDGGDFVVVINSDRVIFTGKKAERKTYYRHTGYIGGIKAVKADDQLVKDSRKVIEMAVGGMLPSGVLGHRLLGKLKIYRDSEHPHAAQQPKVLAVSRTGSLMSTAQS